MSLLQVHNLVVEFPVAVRCGRWTASLFFDIAPGEIFGRGGRVGCGQVRSRARPSSACLSRPGVAGGDLCWSGQRIDNLPLRADAPYPRAPDRAIFQDPRPRSTRCTPIGRQLTETIQTIYQCHARGAPTRHSALEDTGILRRRSAHRPPSHQFSGGMRQRGYRPTLAVAARSSSPTSSPPRWTCPSRRRSSACSNAFAKSAAPSC